MSEPREALFIMRLILVLLAIQVGALIGIVIKMITQ